MGLFDVSLETANRFYTFGWYGSIFGSAATLVAVFFLMWGTRVRDRDFEENIANLHSAAAASQERAAGLELKSNQAQLDLEKERIERLKLEEKIKPREITPEQKSKVLQLLKNGPKGVVYIRPKSFDLEPEQYARQLSDILKEAGFDVRQTEEATLSWSMFGALILMKDLKNPPPHAIFIQTCFNAVGILLLAYQNPQVTDNSVVIAVSTRF